MCIVENVTLHKMFYKNRISVIHISVDTNIMFTNYITRDNITTPKHCPTRIAGWDLLPSRPTEQITTAPAEVMTGSGN